MVSRNEGDKGREERGRKRNTGKEESVFWFQRNELKFSSLLVFFSKYIKKKKKPHDEKVFDSRFQKRREKLFLIAQKSIESLLHLKTCGKFYYGLFQL